MVKTEKDYIDELLKLYPVMSRKEMEKVVERGTAVMTRFLRRDNPRYPRGTTIGGMSALLKNKRFNFIITSSTTKKRYSPQA